MNTSKQLAVNTVVIFLGKVFTQLLSFILLPLYTSLLTTEEYGVTEVIFTVGTLIASILVLQMDAGMFRKLIEVRDDKKKCKEITLNIFIFSLGLMITFDIIYIIILQIYKINYAIHILGYINSTIMLNMMLQYFRGMGKNIIYSILCCINGAITIICNILFIIILGFGVKGMILAYIVGESTVAVIGGFIIIRTGRGIIVKLNFSIIKSVLLYSIPLVFNGISWWIMNLSNRLVISYLLSYSHNGIYAVSNKFASVLFSVYSIFNLAWTETVSVKINNNKFSKEIKVINDSICEALLYLCTFIVATMYIVFPLLVKSSYFEGYNYIPILILAVYFNCLGAQLGGLLVAMKNSKIIAQTSMIGAVVNFLINITLIKKLGLYAAAISTLIAYFVMFVARYRIFRKSEITFLFKTYILPSAIMMTSLYFYYVNNIAIKTVNLTLVIVVIIFRYRNLINSTLKKIYSKM